MPHIVVSKFWEQPYTVGGAYARDKIISERLYAKNAGALMHKGGVFTGHYGIVPFQELKDTYTYLRIIYIMLRHSTIMYVTICSYSIV